MARGLADCLVTNGNFSHFLLQNKAYIGQFGKFRRVSITKLSVENLQRSEWSYFEACILHKSIPDRYGVTPDGAC